MRILKYVKDIDLYKNDLYILNKLNLFYKNIEENKIITLYFGDLEIIISYGNFDDYKFIKRKRDYKITKKSISDILKGIIENERKQQESIC